MSEALEKINKACKYLLSNNVDNNIKQYLNSRISEKSQEAFDFGYFPEIEKLNLLTNLVSRDDLNSENVIYSRQIEDSLFPRLIDFSYFTNYPVVMPYKDQYGRVQGIVGRTLFSDSERSELQISKYKNTNTFKKSHHLFGLYENKQFIAKSFGVYLVEGQFDVIKAYEHGIRNVVAIGSCNMSDTQLSLIKRFTNNLFILFDNDKAGIKGREKLIQRYSKYANIKNAFIPSPYKDLDEYFTNLNGREISINIEL